MIEKLQSLRDITLATQLLFYGTSSLNQIDELDSDDLSGVARLAQRSFKDGVESAKMEVA
jgi:hypothetical protein